MDDNERNNTEQPNSEVEKHSSDNKSESKIEEKEKLSISKLISSKFTEYKSEFKKIIWPSRKVLAKQTVTVIVVSLLFGFIIFCLDTVYSLGVQLFVGLIG